jgi:hypothetical protein
MWQSRQSELPAWASDPPFRPFYLTGQNNGTISQHDLYQRNNETANYSGRAVQGMKCIPRSNTGIAGSNPTQDMDVSLHLFDPSVILK